MAEWKNLDRYMHHYAGHYKSYIHWTFVYRQSSFPGSFIILTIAILLTYNTIHCFAFPIFEHVCLAIKSIWINQYHKIHLWLVSSSAGLYLSNFWGTQRMVPQLLVFTRICCKLWQMSAHWVSTEFCLLPCSLLG